MMDDSKIIRPNIWRWMPLEKQHSTLLSAYWNESTPENLAALVELLVPRPPDEAGYSWFLRDLLALTLPVALRLLKNKIAKEGWEDRSMALWYSAANKCYLMTMRWLYEMDRILVGGQRFPELLAKEDRQNRFQLHKLIGEGMSEGQALKKAFPEDSNRRRRLRNWIKKGLWPLTEEELQLLETESD
jgi:hypothetical protein